MKRKQRLVAAVAAVGCSLVVTAFANAQVTWVGPTTDNLWSNANNFGGIPPAGQDIVFGDTGTATTAETVTNVVDTDQTINSLLFNNTGASFHTTQINAGVTLTITGDAGLHLGMMTTGSSVTTQAAITGGGTLNLNAPTGSFIVTNENSSGVSKATLDMRGLSTFNANVTNFFIGTKVDGSSATGARTLGDVFLADTNAITASTMIIGWDNTNQRNSSLSLGRANTINVDTLYVAREKTGVVTMAFATGLANATLTLRGKAGGNSRVNLLSVSDFSAQSTSGVTPGNNLLDFRGGTVDAMINTLTVGVGQKTTGTGRNP